MATEAEAKIQIQSILNSPQEFIMGHGGEGMQFLSYNISQYSPRYSPGIAREDTALNIYYNKIPFFYKVLGTLISDGGTTSELIDQMYQLLSMHSSTKSIEAALAEAEYYHSIKVLPPLLRTHFSNNDYFTTNNTWFLHLNEYKWFEYKWMLWFTKVWNNVIYQPDFKSVIDSRKTYFYLKNSAKLALFDDLSNMLIQSGATSVHEGHIAYIEFSRDSFTELPVDYLSIPISELVTDYKPRIPEFYAERSAWLAGVGTVNKINIINYSQIFDFGYLENMFEITGTDFHDLWLGWHTKNLEIIESHGHSIVDYQL